MMHLNDEQIQRTLHDELTPHDGAEVRAHAAECATCRASIEQARTDAQTIDALLMHLDHALPRPRAATIIRRAQPRSWRWIHSAAALCVLTLGGVAWAAPGSPLPALARRLVALVRGAPPGVSRPQAAAPPALQSDAPESPPDFAGIAVAPGRRLVIVLSSVERGGAVRVTLTDNGDLVVRAPTGTATFTSTDDRLVIATTGVGTVVELAIPRAAPYVEIRIHGRRVLSADRGGVTTGVALTSGRYVLSLN